MKNKFIFMFLVFMTTAYSETKITYSQTPVKKVVEYCNTNESRDFLEYKFYSEKNRKIPNLKYYANKEFKGAPVITVDSKGLVENNILRCKWKEAEEGETDPVLVLVYPDKPPPEKAPEQCAKEGKFSIVTRYLGCGHGAGTGIWLEVDRVADDYYEVDFDGKVLFLNKKDLGDFVYHKGYAKTQMEKKIAEQKKYEEKLNSDKFLKKAISDIRKCTKERNEKCLNSDFSELAYDYWVNSICYRNDELIKETSAEKFCDVWNTRVCDHNFPRIIEWIDIRTGLYQCGNPDNDDNTERLNRSVESMPEIRKKIGIDSPEYIATKQKIRDLFWSKMDNIVSQDPQDLDGEYRELPGGKENRFYLKSKKYQPFGMIFDVNKNSGVWKFAGFFNYYNFKKDEVFLWNLK